MAFKHKGKIDDLKKKVYEKPPTIGFYLKIYNINLYSDRNDIPLN